MISSLKRYWKNAYYAVKHPILAVHYRRMTREFALSPRLRRSEYDRLAADPSLALNNLLGPEAAQGMTKTGASFSSLIGRMKPYMETGHPVEEAIFLYQLVSALEPRILVETGTSVGVSSAFILQAIKDSSSTGRLYSFDILPRKDVGTAIPPELLQNFVYVKGTTRKKLVKKMAQLGQIDFFFHDSDHSYRNMLFEFRTAWKFLNPGGLLLTHDSALNDAFLQFRDEIQRPVVIFKTPNYLGGVRKPSE